MSFAERWQQLQPIIESNAIAPEITVVAVTKYATIEQMQEAYQAGARHFGENKVQDALQKMAQFPTELFPDLQWHLIGSLQSNKVKKTVGRFSLIQSVDRLTLAQALSKANEDAHTVQPVLLQVNISNDPTRHGFLPATLESVTDDLQALSGLEIKGLMAMAPPELSLAGAKDLIESFKTVVHLQEKLQSRFKSGLHELSLGMSSDFPQALACGATIIRIGNYLFKT